eukprot:g48121.t1
MQWTCECCDSNNPVSNNACSTCNLPRGTKPSSYQSIPSETVLDDGLVWESLRQSDNVEDRRGDRGEEEEAGSGVQALLSGETPVQVFRMFWDLSPAQKLGVAALCVCGLVVIWTLDLDITQMHQTRGQGDGAHGSEEMTRFVAKILGETEDVWGQQLPKQIALQYIPPTLVLFSGYTRSGCGEADAATGPFYCPSDQRVYLDTSFFQEMVAKYGGGGNLGYAYVIAHEVGHHVEKLLGVLDQQAQARSSGASKVMLNQLSVKVELLADCLSGVWAHFMNQRHGNIKVDDVKQAIATASAIGDDRLQTEAQGYSVPDSFTHGTSQQRVHAFTLGMTEGLIASCLLHTRLNLSHGVHQTVPAPG